MSARRQAALSGIDTERFGIRVAKAAEVTAVNLPDVLHFCRDHDVELLIARCPATDIAAVHAMEAAGFRLMDCLCYYGRDLEELPPRDLGACPGLRIATAEDARAVEQVAQQAFAGHQGHYHADPRLDARDCDAVYASWARRSCEAADTIVILAEGGSTVVGFATLRMRDDGIAEGVLAAVLPAWQGRGVYRRLIIERLHKAKGLGARRTVTSAHIANLSAIACWTSLRYQPEASYYTMHRWFTEPRAAD